jgi:integrase
MVGAHHAGWKNPALDKKWYMQVHWLPAETYGRWFLQLWQCYMEQIASIERHHPFAFINTERAVGGMYTIKQYNKALEAAVERIGLTFGKASGTTPHGSRHAYGQRAKRGEVDQVIIQRIMHHCSPDSQLVYTQPQQAETANALAEAARRLSEGVKRTPSGLLPIDIVNP